MKRIDGRRYNQLREIFLQKHYQIHPAGSAIIEIGNTKVICSATIEDKVPPFLKGTGTGWISAEYSMLPGSTEIRSGRKTSGRDMEIQRLIGRSLRAVTDLSAFGEKTITVDCDVIQADGGTRTASITGAFVALVEAFTKIYEKGSIFPVKDFVAAISAGINSNHETILDLNYFEDSNAIADCNVVKTASDKFVEIQITGEKNAFSREEFNKILDLAEIGINKLFDFQKNALGNLAWHVGQIA